MDGKVAVLQSLLANKDIIFGSFNPSITKELKFAKWKEAWEIARSVGIVHENKPWQYLRDVVWANWKKRTIGKIDNAKKTGTGGGSDSKLTNVDLLVLDIIGKDSPILSGVGSSDILNGQECGTAEVVPEPATEMSPPGPLRKVTDRGNFLKRKKFLAAKEEDEKKKRKLDLQLRHLELQNYKAQLETLEAEIRLGLKRSDFTKDLPALTYLDNL